MKRYILTGTPGCGKTSVIHAIEMKGYFTVAEAATDVIAYEQTLNNQEPWMDSNFIDHIVLLQKQRQTQIDNTLSQIQFYDRSPICTYALALYLGFEPSVLLMEEIDRILTSGIYQKKVFFIENLGFCTPTEARKISFKESLIFEQIHKETYAKFGYMCTKIPAISLLERVNLIVNQTIYMTKS